MFRVQLLGPPQINMASGKIAILPEGSFFGDSMLVWELFRMFWAHFYCNDDLGHRAVRSQDYSQCLSSQYSRVHHDSDQFAAGFSQSLTFPGA